MATLSKPLGYECELVEQVSEDYYCKKCEHVAREPNITSCCTEVLCRACIDAVIQSKEPCPSCKNNDITSLGLHKKYQPRILALNVHCLMKNRGCPWNGQLQFLDAHLDATTGDCDYVDMSCPNDCNQKVQKCNLETHLRQECPKRDYGCLYCSYRATFLEVTEHLKTCEQYSPSCPNKCGVTLQQDQLEDHIKVCGQQKVQCELSAIGCQAEFLRDKQKEHMEQNSQHHLALMAAATLKISQTFEEKLQKQQQIFEQKLENQQETFERKLQEQNQMLQQELSAVRMEIGIPPYDITFRDYQENKREDITIDSPPMYTHPGGHKFRLKVWPNGWSGGCIGINLSVGVYSLRGDHDYRLEYPANFKLTLSLLNQHRDQDHRRCEINCEVRKETIDHRVGANWPFVPLADLEWNADMQTQYLKDNCLIIRITEIVLQ